MAGSDIAAAFVEEGVVVFIDAVSSKPLGEVVEELLVACDETCVKECGAGLGFGFAFADAFGNRSG